MKIKQDFLACLELHYAGASTTEAIVKWITGAMSVEGVQNPLDLSPMTGVSKALSATRFSREAVEVKVGDFIYVPGMVELDMDSHVAEVVSLADDTLGVMIRTGVLKDTYGELDESVPKAIVPETTTTFGGETFRNG